MHYNLHYYGERSVNLPWSPILVTRRSRPHDALTAVTEGADSDTPLQLQALGEGSCGPGEPSWIAT